MSEDKGGEYTKRLSQELKSSLYQRGQEGGLWDGHMTPGDLQVGPHFSVWSILHSSIAIACSCMNFLFNLKVFMVQFA